MHSELGHWIELSSQTDGSDALLPGRSFIRSWVGWRTGMVAGAKGNISVSTENQNLFVLLYAVVASLKMVHK
jgi:hypothetical protein